MILNHKIPECKFCQPCPCPCHKPGMQVFHYIQCCYNCTVCDRQERTMINAVDKYLEENI